MFPIINSKDPNMRNYVIEVMWLLNVAEVDDFMDVLNVVRNVILHPLDDIKNWLVYVQDDVCIVYTNVFLEKVYNCMDDVMDGTM